MNALNITKHSIDRTALIAGIMFAFAGLAYLVDDHGIINVTEGAVAGTIVIVIGLVLLLAAVIDSPDVPVVAADGFADANSVPDAMTPDAPAVSTTDQADFSWSNPVGAEPTDETDEIFGIDEAE